MRSQRWEAVHARIDGDAHLHIWAPNKADDPFHVDLSDHVAFMVHRGIGARPPREPHWTDKGGMTVIVDLSLGADGAITINGNKISIVAATSLAAAGFVAFLEGVVFPEIERGAAHDDGEVSEDRSDDPDIESSGTDSESGSEGKHGNQHHNIRTERRDETDRLTDT